MMNRYMKTNLVVYHYFTTKACLVCNSLSLA